MKSFLLIPTPKPNGSEVREQAGEAWADRLGDSCRWAVHMECGQASGFWLSVRKVEPSTKRKNTYPLFCVFEFSPRGLHNNIYQFEVVNRYRAAICGCPSG